MWNAIPDSDLCWAHFLQRYRLVWQI